MEAAKDHIHRAERARTETATDQIIMPRTVSGAADKWRVIGRAARTSGVLEQYSSLGLDAPIRTTRETAPAPMAMHARRR